MKPVLITMLDRAAVERKVVDVERADKIGSDPDDEDAESVATDVEETAEECSEDAVLAEGEDADHVHGGHDDDGDSSGPESAPGEERKSPGTHNVNEHCCAYSTMTRNPAFPDIVYSYHSIWRKPEESRA